MQVLHADFLKRMGSEILAARLRRFPPMSANMQRKHVPAEDFPFRD